jgi:hypothetical protein
MKCKVCRWSISLTERDRGQLYCNRCESELLEQLAALLRNPKGTVVVKWLTT